MNLYPTVVLFVFIYSSLTVREIASLYSHSAMSEAGRERLFTFTALHRVALLLYGNFPFLSE